MSRSNEKEMPAGAALQLAMGEAMDWTQHPGARQVLCPRCAFEYVHCEGAYWVSGYDHYCAWEGRGDVLRVQWWCESRHAWEVCFGCHKGETVCFVEDILVDEEDAGWWPGATLRDARVRALARAQAIHEERVKVRECAQRQALAKGACDDD